MIKTEISFDRSPSHDTADQPGKYCLILHINGQKSPEYTVAEGQESFVVAAPEGAAVQVFLSYRNNKGLYSAARQFNFVVRTQAPPLPPGQMSIKKATKSVSLPVLA
jgi:hypothetical protein